jgi:hypothetical protein
VCCRESKAYERKRRVAPDRLAENHLEVTGRGDFLQDLPRPHERRFLDQQLGRVGLGEWSLSSSFGVEGSGKRCGCKLLRARESLHSISSSSR